MKPIRYIDRVTKRIEVEQVYGEKALRLLYTKKWAAPLLFLSCRSPLFSKIYGWWQSLPVTKRKILPFIEKYQIDPSAFIKAPDQFSSFNDFFIRKLKPAQRPISSLPLILPADGRYRFFPDIEKSQGFYVKGKKFDLEKLLQNRELAKKYQNGTMLIARLCPTDYHRFHFPCDGIPSATQQIQGALYSVNPLALKKNIEIFTENKRTLTKLKTEMYGTILILEIGATCVGTIHQTYMPNSPVKKGEEKGFFSFGGSSIILLFEPNTITLAKDLSCQGDLEIKCLFGQSLEAELAATYL